MAQYYNPFRLNQLGYPQKAAKRFVYVGESSSDVFTLCIMRDGGLQEVLTGKFELHNSE